MSAPEAPVDFAIVLPPGWVRVPLQGDVRAEIVGLVTQRVAQVPVDRREGLRTAMTRELIRAAQEAEQIGGIDMLMNVEPINGIPVPASCLVSYLDPDGRAVPIEGLVDQLSGSGAQVDVVELAGGPAVRRWSTRQEPVEVGDQPIPEGLTVVDAVTVTDVTFYLPVPGRTGTLMFAFCAPVEPFAQALTGLFDAMAGSLRWVWR